MSKLNNESRTFRALLMAGVATSVFAFQPVFAQDEEDLDDDDRIVVTGSRLVGSPTSVAAPVLQVTAEDLLLRGTTQIEDYINTLPQAFAAQTSEVANGANGAASINLRGLGAVRTLSLIDGKRLPYGALSSAAGNINLVPTQLVERVDVVTGGASAVYGSDAIAGVVNFVLKDDFEGFELDVQGSFFSDGNDNELAAEYLRLAGQPIPDANTFDGWRTNVAAIFGSNFDDDRGNVTVFFQYLRQSEMVGRDHDVGACSLGTGTGPLGAGCVGSSNFRRLNSNIGEGAFFQREDGTLVPLGSVSPEERTFNFGAFNFFQRPIERYSFYGKAHYDFFENMRGYINFQYQDNSTDAQIAPSASFNRNFSLNCDHPFINEGLGPNGDGRTYFDLLGCAGDEDGIVSFIHSHRNVEGLPRVLTFDFSTFRVLGGIEGGFLDDVFTYDVFAQFSRTNGDRISRGDLSVENIQQALFATTDEQGNVVCTDPSRGCVPWNIFQRPGGQSGVTPEAAAFVQGTGITIGTIEQVVIGATLAAELGEYGYVSPFADEGIQVLIGTEFRGDTLDRIPDEISQLGNQGLTGTGGAQTPLTGEVRVREIFTEVRVPLIQGVNFIQDFTVQGAYRYSDYETEDSTGNTGEFDATTFNVGGTWQPVDDIRFRAQFQRAIRAPNVFELFSDVTSGLFDLPSEDPCSGAVPVATFEQCARSGVTAAQFGNIEQSAAGQYNSITGGNRNLEPEESDTITAGFVFTPTFAEGLTVAVDYFNIDISSYINSIPPTTTLNLCIEQGQFCDLIRRDSLGTLWLQGFTADGELAGVVATNQNIAEYSTDGFDINVDYTFDLNRFDLTDVDLGSFNVNYAASYLLSLDFVDFDGAPTTECAGNYLPPCTGSGSVVGVPAPKYRHQAQFTWFTPLNVDIRATWRYFGSVDGINPPNRLNESIDAINWLDVSVNWEFYEGMNFRAGVNNVLDTDPPLVSDPGTGQGNNNTFPGVYDATGQYWFFGINIRR